jgi:hypothetical protein
VQDSAVAIKMPLLLRACPTASASEYNFSSIFLIY